MYKQNHCSYVKLNCLKLLSKWLNSVLMTQKELIHRITNQPTNQLLLSNNNTFIYTQLNSFKYCYLTLIILWNKVKLATIVEGNPKAPFSIATTPMCRGGRYSFPGLLYFTLDPYLIMLSVKQGGIKYHFLSLWYDSTWDWTQVSRPIGEHSNP